MYSGTLLLWTPLGQLELSLFQRYPYFSGSLQIVLYAIVAFETMKNVLISVCPDLRGFTVVEFYICYVIHVHV